VYGQNFSGGHSGYWQAGRFAPSGRIMAFDDERVYVFGRKPEYYRWTTAIEHHLWSAPRQAPALAQGADAGAGRQQGSYHVKFDWNHDIPLYVRAMVLTGGTLFVAGPPDLVDEGPSRRGSDPKRLADPGMAKRLTDQAAAFDGQGGALLWVVRASDGMRLAEHRLASPPAWDGMAAADGRLYFSTVDGKVACWGVK
jgi:outer membrane protein assembly factor BamB